MHIINEYVLLSRDIALDEVDKMFSIFKIIDRFIFNIDLENAPESIKSIPLGEKILLPISYVITTSWSTDKEITEDALYLMKVGIVDPRGTQISELEQSVPIRAGGDKFRFNITLQSLPCTVSGQYQCIAKLCNESGKVMAEGAYRFKVEL